MTPPLSEPYERDFFRAFYSEVTPPKDMNAHFVRDVRRALEAVCGKMRKDLRDEAEARATAFTRVD